MSAVANTLSADKKKWLPPASFLSFWKKRFKILLPYTAASIFSYLVLNFPKMNFTTLFHDLLFFRSQPTYYFINLICQLYLIFPFLYSLLQYFRQKWQILVITVGMIFLSLSVFSLKQPPWPFSPAGRLFGSVYLLVFWLGMLLGKGILNPGLYSMIIVFCIWGASEILIFWSYGSYVRIPYAYFIWSLSLLLVIKFVVERLGVKLLIFRVLQMLGRASISIYLLHFLILILLSRTAVFQRAGLWPLAATSIFFSLIIGYLSHSTFRLIRSFIRGGF